MSRKPPLKKLLRQVSDWNSKHKIGTRVRYWPGMREGEGRIGTTKTEASILGGHTAGVYLSARGFVALSHVKVLAEREP